MLGESQRRILIHTDKKLVYFSILYSYSLLSEEEEYDLYLKSSR